MKILISNDDGIHSEGIYHLAKNLSAIGKVFVVAPDREQSATAHSITMHEPIRCKKTKFFDTDIDAWWVSGTPADCVKLGIESLIGEKPDLVVSGINRGDNMGTDVLYSGTVSAAIEGLIFGVPAIAFSYLDFHEDTDFSLPARIARSIVEEYAKNGLPPNTVLNVNIPICKSITELAGTKVTRLGVKKYVNIFEKRQDPRGRTYYWLAGDLVDTDQDEDTDIQAVKNRYISLTPIHIDLTNYKALKDIEKWQIKLEDMAPSK